MTKAGTSPVCAFRCRQFSNLIRSPFTDYRPLLACRRMDRRVLTPRFTSVLIKRPSYEQSMAGVEPESFKPSLFVAAVLLFQAATCQRSRHPENASIETGERFTSKLHTHKLNFVDQTLGTFTPISILDEQRGGLVHFALLASFLIRFRTRHRRISWPFVDEGEAQSSGPKASLNLMLRLVVAS